MSIWFHNQSSTKDIKNKRLLKSWIRDTIKARNFKPGDINVIIVNDDDILEINRKYLSHNYYTDVITFDYSDEKKISGDIYVSLDTVSKNASLFSQSLNSELKRVIIHGVLHLLGLEDSTAADSRVMRLEEDLALEQVKDLLII